MNFDEFNNSVYKTSLLVRESGFECTGIVAIARGGWIPARLLAKYLSVKKLYSWGLKYQDVERTQLHSYDQPSPPLRGERVLIVEDFLESGRSMNFVCEILRQENEIASFAINYHEHSVVVPDFTLGVVSTVPELSWD